MNEKRLADEIFASLSNGHKAFVEASGLTLPKAADLETFFRERANNIAQNYADRLEAEVLQPQLTECADECQELAQMLGIAANEMMSVAAEWRRAASLPREVAGDVVSSLPERVRAVFENIAALSK